MNSPRQQALFDPAEPQQDETAFSFRSIHYLGSKYRLSAAIADALDEVAGKGEGATCDLFAGSGATSLALSRDSAVVAVDIQEYSRVLCSALLAPVRDTDLGSLGIDQPPLAALLDALAPIVDYERECIEHASEDPESLCELIEHGSLVAFDHGGVEAARGPLRRALDQATRRLKKHGLWTHPGTTASRYFGGRYFSFSQALQLDAILERVHGLPSAQRDYFLAAVLSVASEIANTVGKQFAQPIQPRDAVGRMKMHLMRHILRDRSMCVPELFHAQLSRFANIPRPRHHNLVVRQDYRDFLRSFSGRIRAFYADPPYTREHYSRFYHVLETLCYRDNPRVSTTRLHGEERLSRALYREERHQSPFCIKSQAPSAFSELLSGIRLRNAPLVLSYAPRNAVHNGLIAVDTIVQLAREYFSDVEVRSPGRHAHNRFNRKELNSPPRYDSEVLVVCRP